MATGTPPPKYTYTTITFNYPGTVNLIDVIGVEQERRFTEDELDEA
jgi:hypothetical protein